MQTHMWGLENDAPFEFSFNTLVDEQSMILEVAMHVIRVRQFHHHEGVVYRKDGLQMDWVGHAEDFLTKVLFGPERTTGGDEAFPAVIQCLLRRRNKATDVDSDGVILMRCPHL